MSAPSRRPTEAFRSTSLFEKGTGYVSVARFKRTGDAEIGIFLVDVFCLGVKDAFFLQYSPGEYREQVLERAFEAEGRTPMSPACARKLVENAVAYAAGLGFAPHSDYRKGCRVFGGIDAGECTETFVFGKDGKPLYIQGPNESSARARQIVAQLERRCGHDNYHFLMALAAEELAGFEDEEDADLPGPEER
jgi:hypothetical protein